MIEVMSVLEIGIFIFSSKILCFQLNGLKISRLFVEKVDQLSLYAREDISQLATSEEQF